jgi:uncharacterized protein
MIRIVFLLFLLASSLFSIAQLERRPLLGIQMQNENNAVLIMGTVQNSTAAMIGLKKGDTLISINGKKAVDVQSAISFIRELKAGDSLQVVVKRTKDTALLKGIVQSFPIEAASDIVTEYGMIQTPVAKLRSIFTLPKVRKKHPAVLFITGVSCYSVDFGLDTSRTELSLLRGFTRNGFVTMRIDRPGLGDSKGSTSCMMDDLYGEASHFKAALAALKNHPAVDSNRIYLFGHSMGSVFAPMIAAGTNIKGIITYGGLGRPFVEYMGDAFMQQAKLKGSTGEQLDSLVKINQLAANLLLNGLISQDSLRKRIPQAETVAAVFDIRSPQYFYQLHQLNLASLWKQYKGSVLIMMGEYDYVAHKADQHQLLETINNFGNARAELHFVPHSDHGMSKFNSIQEVLKEEPGKGFNQAILNHILQWINQQA